MKRTQDQQLSFCQLTLSCVAHHPKALPRLSSWSADKHDSEDMLVIGNCSSNPVATTVLTHEECVLIRRRKCPCSVRMCKLGQCTLPILGACVCAIIPKMASECRTVSCYDPMIEMLLCTSQIPVTMSPLVARSYLTRSMFPSVG